MKRVGKLDAIFGIIIPWITLILLIGVTTYYCESLVIRLICVITAIVNGSVRYSYYEGGKQKSVYSWRLELHDKLPVGKMGLC